MTAEETPVVAEVVIPQEQPKKVVEESENDVQEDWQVKEVQDYDDSKPKTVQKSSSYKEESNFLSDLKEFEKKALNEFKSKLEEAILGNNLFKKKELKKKQKESEEKEKSENKEETEKEKEPENGEESEKQAQEEAEMNEQKAVEENGEEIDKDVSIWGTPLLPSKGAEGTDVILLKFLRAREFKVNEAFEMLKKTLQWRKESNIDSISDEDLQVDLSSAFHMNGIDREGHPVCYNIYGVFGNEELYTKAFGTEENRKQFLRWRFQLMEKGIRKLDLKPGGVTSLLQISDLKNSPSPLKKDLRVAMKQAVGILQDNYPELVARNVSFFCMFSFFFI